MAVGDEIVSLCGEAVRDIIQYRMLADEADPWLEVRRGGLELDVEVAKRAGEPLGIELDAAVFDRVRTCDNHCEFCFIYQLPPGMRRSLSLKDDDYRLSFLFGNFTTLTRFTEADLERVITEGLSPLYVSIHATDPLVRADMLRNRRGATSLRWLRQLLDHGVTVHGQLVICPGVNDGTILEDTLCGIADSYPELATVAVVPLGLSRYNTAERMRLHTTAEAASVLDIVEAWQARFLDILHRRVVFAADEYYLMAGRAFPPADAYEGFPLHEDGVGMARAFAAALRGEIDESHSPQPGFFAWSDAATATAGASKVTATVAGYQGPAVRARRAGRGATARPARAAARLETSAGGHPDRRVRRSGAGTVAGGSAGVRRRRSPPLAGAEPVLRRKRRGQRPARGGRPQPGARRRTGRPSLSAARRVRVRGAVPRRRHTGRTAPSRRDRRHRWRFTSSRIGASLMPQNTNVTAVAALPHLAIVGRPNVGKSTLVNRLVGRQEAIVEQRPGVTRDRKALEGEWQGRRFIVIDTGGWLPGGVGTDLDAKVSRQSERAMADADAVLFVVDGTVGTTEEDGRVAAMLRRVEADKPVFVVVNKIDHPNREAAAWEFLSLGLGDPFIISALHGTGTGDLLDAVLDAVRPEGSGNDGTDEPGEVTSAATATDPDGDVDDFRFSDDAFAAAELDDDPAVGAGRRAANRDDELYSVAIVGRPNVGKSTLFNRLIGDDRAVVHDMPGTTRDAIDTVVDTDFGPVRFVDTAGMRRRSKIGHGDEHATEYFSMVRALRAVDHADVALLVIDATQGVTHQDQRLAERLDAAGCPIVILLNKWELLEAEQRERVSIDVADRLRFLGEAPVVKLSRAHR